VLTVNDRLASIRAALGSMPQAASNRDEVTVDSGLAYGTNVPVRVRIRRRGRRYDLTDDGAAAARAGLPAGWLKQADRLVADEGFNVNRRGVVFVPAVEGRDIAMLALRLADTSRRLYVALVELGDQHSTGRRHRP